MLDWLGTQAQTASPFVAVFCMMVVTVLLRVVSQLYKANEQKNQTIITISRSSIEANNAVAMAIEKSTGTLALAIEGLKGQIQNGNGGRRR